MLTSAGFRPSWIVRPRSLAGWVKEVNLLSSLWVKEREPGVRNLAWQAGYGAFSVSASNAEKVQRYIEGQVEHHRTVTFQDEYRALLRKHGMEWDERYVWD